MNTHDEECIVCSDLFQHLSPLEKLVGSYLLSLFLGRSNNSQITRNLKTNTEERRQQSLKFR